MKRTIDACSNCGSTVKPGADGPCCEGAEIVTVTVWSPTVARWRSGRKQTSSLSDARKKASTVTTHLGGF